MNEVTFSSLIDKVWLPASIRYGISIRDFYELNPKYMKIYQDEYIKKKEEEMKLLDMSAYYHGLYVQMAVGSCLSKKGKYPKEPLSIKEEKRKKLENMSDEEFYARFRGMIGKMNKKIKG